MATKATYNTCPMITQDFLSCFYHDAQKLLTIYNKQNDQDWIHRSYPHFIRFFRDKKINEHHVMIGRYFTYGWMPTILKKTGDASPEYTTKIVKYLNNVKKHNEPKFKCHELECISHCINNSVVGTSKLLHFINPYVYAIIDSRVCNYLNNRKFLLDVNMEMTDIFSKQNVLSGNNKYKAYNLYLKFCHKLTQCPEIDSYRQCFQSDIIKKYPEYESQKCEITTIRFIEYVMYFNI